MSRSGRLRAIGVLPATALVTLAPGPGPAAGPPQVGAPASAAARVPFGPGEDARYELKLGVLSVGEASLSVNGVETVRGHPSYQLEMTMTGGYLFARVDDTFRSWMDVRTLASRRFIRNVHEINYRSLRHFEIYPEERRWERADVEESGATLSPLPLDELAFIYYVRSLPLRVGETYELNRYFKEDGNPVVVRVLRKERREVPAGTFNTIVVQPIIRTSGLFSEGGKAEIHFSDDEHRHVVYLRSQIPKLGVGSITLHLTAVRPGETLAGPAAPGARPGSPRQP